MRGVWGYLGRVVRRMEKRGRPGCRCAKGHGRPGHTRIESRMRLRRKDAEGHGCLVYVLLSLQAVNALGLAA